MTIEEIKQQIAGIRVGGGVYTVKYQEGCTLTDQQKADINVSNLIHKWATQIPIYLDECADIRDEDPGMSDRMVRRLATAGMKVGA